MRKPKSYKWRYGDRSPNLERMRKTKRKRYNHNIRCKNLSTVNISDRPETTKQRMHDQILMLEANDGTSVVPLVATLSRSTPPTAGCCWGHRSGNGVIFTIDIPCLVARTPLKHMMLITIQSNFLTLFCSSIRMWILLTAPWSDAQWTHAPFSPQLILTSLLQWPSVTCIALHRYLHLLTMHPSFSQGSCKPTTKLLPSNWWSGFSFSFPVVLQGAMCSLFLLLRVWTSLSIKWLDYHLSIKLLDYHSLKPQRWSWTLLTMWPNASTLIALPFPFITTAQVIMFPMND